MTASEDMTTEERLEATARYSAVSHGAETVQDTMRESGITLTTATSMYVASNVLVALERSGHVTLNIDPKERLRVLVENLEALDRQFPGKMRILMGAELSDRLLFAVGLHDEALAIERAANPMTAVVASDTPPPGGWTFDDPCDPEACCEAGWACSRHESLHNTTGG